MGLISQAKRVPRDGISGSEQQDIPFMKKKSGLLSRIKKASAFDIVDSAFDEFMHSVGAERGGILFPSGNECLSFLFPRGFDYTTSRRFFPSVSAFAHGFPNEEWVSITGNGLETWQSLFSFRELKSLSSLSIRKVILDSANVCYLAIATSLLDIVRAPIDFVQVETSATGLIQALAENTFVLQALAPFENINKSREAMKSHAESALSSRKTATLAKISCEALFPDDIDLQTDCPSLLVYNAIVHRIARLAGTSNIIYADATGTVRIVLFTSFPADTGFYFLQLMKPLERLFGVDRIRKLVAVNIGNTNSASEILDFLSGAN